MTTPHVPPDILASLDETLLTRYMAGIATARESSVVRQWASAEVGRQAALDDLRNAWQASVASETPVWPTELSWMRLKQAVQGTLVAPRVTPVHPARWRSIAFGGVLLGAIALVAVGRLAVTSPVSVGAVYQTAAGARSTFTLTDGTQITLGPASRIQLAPGYGSRTREVTLEGEAYFSVIHDTRHPFAVLTHNLQINDVGTEFDVRAYDANVRVAVRQGEVLLRSGPPLPRPLPFAFGAGRGEFINDVREGGSEKRAPSAPVSATRPYDGNNTAYLTAGDMAEATDTGFTVMHHADIAAATAWRQGGLEFNGVPLDKAIHDVARTFDVEITIADSSVASTRVTGSFEHETIDQVLDDITSVVGARYERHGRTVVIYHRANVRGPSEGPAPLRTARSQG